MKKFGFKKSGDGDDQDSNRRALFGSRSKDKNPPATNPYATPIRSDPYAKAKINAGIAPPPPGMEHMAPSEPKPDAPGYAPNAFGNQDGYGSDRFGARGTGGAAKSSRYGAGGYGGLGAVDPNDPVDANRDALFGGARERVQQQNRNGAPPPYSENTGGYDGGGDDGGADPYNTSLYQERQLTAEEEEEEEIKSVKQDLRFIKQGDVSSTRNALRAAAQAEEVGRNTLARLGAQGEKIHDTEKSLDSAAIESRIAEEKARELRTLNKSMFAVHVSNPFTSAQRRRDRDLNILNTNRTDRENREGTRLEAFKTNQRMDRNFRDLEKQGGPGAARKANLLERKKYQFEADSEDEAMEDEIEQNMTLLDGAAGRLNGLARATNRELDEQNGHLDRIMGKVRNQATFYHVISLDTGIIRETNNHHRATWWTIALPSTVPGWTVFTRGDYRHISYLL